MFIPPYRLVLRTYFRWIKVPLSRLAGRVRPSIPWEPPTFASLDEYAAWMKEHLRWRSDPLAGVFDIFPMLGQMAWQLDRKGVAADDCDGLAYFSAAVVRSFADRPADVYVVTVVLNPVALPLRQAAHVMCFFRMGGVWRVISSAELFPRSFTSFQEALVENPYCRGHTILFSEVRDASLRRVPAPVD